MPDINGIPYVESDDLVSAYPAVSQSLAQEVSDQLASKLDEAGGKILQVVRATDATQRTTTSTSFVDASINVTITPQKSDSAILLIWNADVSIATTSTMQLQITDNSNNAISGAQGRFITLVTGYASSFNMIGYATPATTSATTYKGRFRSTDGASVILANSNTTGQMYAIEVSA